MASTNESEAADSIGHHVNISIRVSREFRDWLDQLAARSRVGRSVAVEHGLLLLAQANEFEVPPPKR
jgi:predicted transcriptional regulator